MNDIDSFRKSVHEIIASIPAGKVLTYGQIAWLAGFPRHSRLVGKILSATESGKLPCHRVVNSQGRTAPHWKEQRKLLEAEGVAFRKNDYVDMKAHNWNPSAPTQK